MVWKIPCSSWGRSLFSAWCPTFGTYAIAANAVCNAVANFQILPGMAINLAITAVIARCVGAGDYEQAEYFTKKLIRLVYLCIWIVNLIVLCLMPLVLWAYNLSDITAQTARSVPVLPQCERMPDMGGIILPPLRSQGGGRREGDHGDITGFNVDLPHYFQLCTGRLFRAGRARRVDRYGHRLVRESSMHDSAI